jgi:phosphoribosyl-ATP pyrophosphohydrolase/phosphoribosyl-ATP pyrophosphohydrolase/phosphoribosyl-AMP cyclohydrolase
MDTEIIKDLIDIIRERKNNPNNSSYTCRLLYGGENKIIKKLGEEFAEFLKAYLTESSDRLVSEIGDLIYHIMVALEYKNIPFENVLDELRKRYKKT